MAQIFGYASAWTDAEAAAYYQSGQSDVREFKPGPVFYYQMQPGSGQTVTAQVGPDLQLGSTSGTDTNDLTWTGPYRKLTNGGPQQ